MTDSATQEAQRTSSVPPPRRGFLLRLILAAAAPAALLGAAGAWLARSLVLRPGEPLPVADYLAAFVPTAVLAVALAVLIAYAVDLTLRGQVELLVRSLRGGGAAETRSLASPRGWGGLAGLAREVKEALGRAEEQAQTAAELKALQAAADDVIGKVREWAQTEITPAMVPEGALAELVSELRLLAGHLDDRAREAREVGQLARESLAEACSGIERAGHESERGAREIATLIAALGEVRRLSAEILAGAGEWRVQAASEPPPAAPPARAPAEDPWAGAAARLQDVARRLEQVERRALRAALESAAFGLGHGLPGDEWQPLVEGNRRTLAEAAEARAAAAALAGEIAAERAVVPSAEAGAVRREPAPSPAAGAAAERVVALAERLSQWARDATARGERLATLAERAAAQAELALSAARASAEELGGLTARFETLETRAEPAAPAAEAGLEDEDAAPGRAAAVESVAGAGEDAAQEAAESSAERRRAAWPVGQRPFRLLTRDDVVPEDEGEQE